MNISGADKSAMEKSKARWDSIAKPLGSLGLLEDCVIRIAGLTGSPEVKLNKRGVIVMCADNGVVSQGVTQTGSEVTMIVAKNIAHGRASVCHMSHVANAHIIAVDMGMATQPDDDALLNRRIADGTADMTLGPAMTREQAQRAIDVGIELVGQCKAKGYKILATGEMGIGNTTTSSAIAAVLLGKNVEDVTGRGAGLSDDGLSRKIGAIKKAIEINKPDSSDALDVLSKLGGFDIAGLAGVFLGGAIHRVPILIDGFISAVAALTAAKIEQNSVCAMLASHVSAEPAAHMVLDALGLKPLITAEMRLGEGTGAVAALPLLDMALAEYSSMDTFNDIGVESYKPL